MIFLELHRPFNSTTSHPLQSFHKSSYPLYTLANNLLLTTHCPFAFAHSQLTASWSPLPQLEHRPDGFRLLFTVLDIPSLDDDGDVDGDGETMGAGAWQGEA